MADRRTGPRPLDGIRVLEVGQMMAGPLAGTFLAYFGADVIKVEPPGSGDAIRSWRVVDEGTSLWWRGLGRNKRSVALDLNREEARDLVRRIAAKCDVLVENFRPGRMEGWGLGPDDLRRENPDLVYARVSGFGQDGPYAHRRGFASVCEAMGGLRYVTGRPGEPSVRPNLSLGDSLGAFQAVIGILLALMHRERAADGAGQVVDVSILESVLGVMESAVSEYDRRGIVREPSGGSVTGVVPTGAYPCGDGRSVVIGANANSLFRRLMRAMARTDMAEDERYAGNEQRVERRQEIDKAITAWTQTLACDEVVRQLDEAGVPAGPIQTVAEIVEDPQVVARGHLEDVEVGGRPLKLPAIGPRLDATPGRTEWPGGEVGAHTEEVLAELLALAPEEIERLRAAGVI
jgi:crotonobetainyl-CoA:carnitine CoA-transferase CaiB-like acyl-CoA transferase